MVRLLEEIKEIYQSTILLLDLIDNNPEEEKGGLVAIQENNSTRFYIRRRRRSNNGKVASEYVSIKSTDELAKIRSQKFYKILGQRLRSNKKSFEYFLKHYQPTDWRSIQAALPKAYRDPGFMPENATSIPANINATSSPVAINVTASPVATTVTPEIPENLGNAASRILYPKYNRADLYVWANANYETNTKEIHNPNYNMSGRKMRSKSEVIISNFLEAYKIPYRSEMRVDLVNDQRIKETRYPDFTIKTPSGKLLFWEHFGLLTNPDYAEAAGRKIQLYAINNIIPGRNLIISADGSRGEIDVREVMQLINTYLLPEFRDA